MNLNDTLFLSDIFVVTDTFVDLDLTENCHLRATAERTYGLCVASPLKFLRPMWVCFSPLSRHRQLSTYSISPLNRLLSVARIESCYQS